MTLRSLVVQSITIVAILPIIRCQIFNSLERFSLALKTENIFANQLENFIKLEERRLHQLKVYSARLLAQSSIRTGWSQDELIARLSLPIQAYRTISDMAELEQGIKELLKPTRQSYSMERTFAALPGQNSKMSAVTALIRLQEVYLDRADFTNATGSASNHDNVLTAEECLEISRFCKQNKDAYCQMTFSNFSYHMLMNKGNLREAMIALELYAEALHLQGNPHHALKYTEQLLKYHRDPLTRKKLSSKRWRYQRSLPADFDVNSPLPSIKKAAPIMGGDRYKALCRAESTEAFPKRSRDDNKCYLVRDHPLLVLAPAKREDLDTEIGLAFFHDVIREPELKVLKDLAGNKFRDSILIPDEATGAYKANETVRSSNTGWVFDSDHPAIKKVSTRVSAITGLSLKSADAFQVLSYGIGGHYLPHYDWSERKEVFGDHGNRIATFIIYLNKIPKGGATVFPNIGAAVWPEKGGAAFWWNLHRNGEGNIDTKHAACPVLEGYKWASNKWFHEYDNEFRRPCDLNANM